MSNQKIMINLTSSNTFDFFDRQNLAGSSEQTESKMTKFDELFTALIFPMLPPSVQKSPEPIEDSTGAANITAEFSAEKVAPSAPSFAEALTNNKPFSAAQTFAAPEKTQPSENLTQDIKPAVKSFEKMLSTAEITPDEMPQTFVSESKPAVESNFFDAPKPAVKPATVESSVLTISPSEIQPNTKVVQVEQTPFKAVFDFNKVPDAPFEKVLSDVSPAAGQTILPLKREIFAAATIFGKVKKASIFNPNAEHLPAAVSVKSEKLFSNDSPIFPVKPSAQTENAVKISTLPNLPENAASTEIAVESPNALTERVSKMSEIQPETIIKTSEKPLRQSEESPLMFFEEISAAIKNDQKITGTTLSPATVTADAFEQIEKPLMQAAILNAKTDEPEILKLRLHPAELGTVEIKLERTETGAIKVHFQTQTEAARHILAQSFEQLKTSLQNSGWQVERMEIVSNQLLSGGSEQQRENQARKNDGESRLNERTSFGGSADKPDDLQQNPSNRLLSVRA